MEYIQGICIHIYIYVYNIYIYIIRICMHIIKNVFTDVGRLYHMHIHIHIHLHIHIYCIYTYIYIHTHIYISHMSCIYIYYTIYIYTIEIYRSILSLQWTEDQQITERQAIVQLRSAGGTWRIIAQGHGLV